VKFSIWLRLPANPLKNNGNSPNLSKLQVNQQQAYLRSQSALDGTSSHKLITKKPMQRSFRDKVGAKEERATLKLRRRILITSKVL
jgi:hypothetical protein